MTFADYREAAGKHPDVAREAEQASYDVTARKAHQWMMVVLIALGFVLGGVAAAVPVAVAGAIMLVGRFWWPADLVRQIVWRVLEPAGVLRRHEAPEDHATRRVARVVGGLVWLGSALLLAAGFTVLPWILSGLVAVMVVLDASVDFCALCFVAAQLARRGARPRWLDPAAAARHET